MCCRPGTICSCAVPCERCICAAEADENGKILYHYSLKPKENKKGKKLVNPDKGTLELAEDIIIDGVLYKAGGK